MVARQTAVSEPVFCKSSNPSFGLAGLQRGWWFWIGREVHSA